MRAGDWVGGTWRLGLELPRGNDWLRIAVEDPSDPPAELIVPMGHALLRPGVREAFVGFYPPIHQAILPNLGSGILGDVPWRVRARTKGPLPGRLSPNAALAIGVAIAPAILAGEGFLGGNLDRGDVSWTLDGRPVLVPTGIPPAEDKSDAPGVAGDAGALGRLLFSLVEGRPPKPGEGALSTPGTQRLSELIAGLLQGDPEVRRVSLQEMAAIPAPYVEPTLPLPANHDPAVEDNLPLPLPSYFIAVRRSKITDAALLHVARESGVALHALQGGGLPETWPVEGTATLAEAERRGKRLLERGIPNEVIPLDERAGWPWLIAAVLLTLESLATTPVAAGMVVRSLLGGTSDLLSWLPIVVAATCALVAAISGRKGIFLALQNDRRREAKRAWAVRHRLQDRNDLDPLFARLARVRDELPMLGLPDLVVEDLRQMLAETGEALEDATQPGAATNLREAVARIIAEIEGGLRDKNLEGIAQLESRFRQERGRSRLPPSEARKPTPEGVRNG